MLYWVRLRGVKTDGELTGQTLFVTGWAEAEPAIAGDWTPRNLQVTPGDRSLAVTWDTVAVADGYEVLYQPEAEVAGSGGAQARSSAAARAAATDDFAVAAPVLAVPSADEQIWAANITGLDNGTTYDVQVRAMRTITTPSGAVTLRSAPAATKGTSGVAFLVVEPSGPRVVWSGGTVTWTVQLKQAPIPPRPDPLLEDLAPFKSRPIGAFVSAGPSTGTLVRCVWHEAAPFEVTLGVYRPCVTSDDGRLRMQYRAALVRTDAESGVDELFVFADFDGDGRIHKGELFTKSEVGSTKIARPINLVALGDSYSAGENGEFRAAGAFGPGSDGGYYLTDNPAAFDCHRWSKAYGRLLPSLASNAYRDVETYACTGAISLNIFHPEDTNYDGVPNRVNDDLGAPSTDPAYVLAVETWEPVHWTVHTNRPSVADSVAAYYWVRSEADQDPGWEPRQALSLSRANARQTVDMVTLTIGGNDLGFAEILRSCYLGGCADDLEPARVSAVLGEFGDTLAEVFEEVKSAAPDAAIFVLGYPYLTDFDEARWRAFFELDDAQDRSEFLADERDRCDALNAYPLLEAINVGLIEANVVIDLVNSFANYPVVWARIVAQYGSGLFGIGDARNRVADAANLLLKIDILEKQRLRVAAESLNDVIEDRAGAAGVHYVDVLEVFGGHDQCGGFPWLNGLVVDAESSALLPRSGRSFHPNAVGHEQYGGVLLDYIDAAIERGDPVNDVGLPTNPAPAPRSATQQASGPRGAAGSSAAAGSGGGSSETGERTDETPGAGTVANTMLWARRVSPATARCSGFLAPGDGVELSAEGFAAGSSVVFSVVAATVSGVLLPEVTIPAATADADGRIEVSWTVPAVLVGVDSSTPRAYFVKATGADAADAALAAFTPGPMVAYPGAAACAADDTAATTVGESVRISVLANDTAPAGGSLDAASVTVAGAPGGVFAVSTTDGSLTFTPDPGFVGTVSARYRVADNWAMRVGATVTVTVDAGCTITGTAGVAEIVGTDGDDVICVPAPKDRSAFHIIDARAGDDIVIGGDGVEWVIGGAGTDTIYGAGGADEITGGPGVDTIHSGAGFDTIQSSDLADTVIDTADGYEFLLTPPSPPAHVAPIAGNDTEYVALSQTLDISVLDNDRDPNQNLVVGSLAITRAPTLGTAGVVVSLLGDPVVRYTAGDSDGVDTFAYAICDTLGACTSAEVTVTVGTAHCTILGTDGDDILSGTPGPDIICGLGGNDTISGLDGDDILIGGPGDDTLYGGDETRIGDNDGNDTLFGGNGDDTLAGGNGDDILWGGAGDDALAGNRRSDILIGGAGADSLNGGGEDDTLWGGAGDDTLLGHAHNDTLHGGPGDDTLLGGNGSDVLWGGAGVDDLTGGAGDDTLRGGPGDDTLRGNTQNDTLYGGLGDDTLRGGGHDDALVGGPGGDALNGDAGDDRLWGTSGDDSVDGGDGADFLDGGHDADTCRRGETTARCER